MKKYILTLALATCCLMAYSQNTKTKEKEPSLIEDLRRMIANTQKALPPSDIYDNAIGSVFTIKTDKKLGSGFVFQESNLLVTNYHVIEGATAAVAMPADSNVEYVIEGVVALDRKLDVAVLRVKFKKKPLMSSLFLPKIGEKAYSIGSPQGLTATFSDGMVSGLREGYIQTTTPISQGSSGGPLLNKYGDVIGMNTLTAVEGQNLNFAVPIASIKSVLAHKFELAPLDFITRYFAPQKGYWFLIYKYKGHRQRAVMEVVEDNPTIKMYFDAKGDAEVENCTLNNINGGKGSYCVQCHTRSFWLTYDKKGHKTMYMTDGETNKKQALKTIKVEFRQPTKEEKEQLNAQR